MGSFQHGPGFLMVEVPGIEKDESRVFPLMLRMAQRALLALVPVVTTLLRHPLRYLLVAGQASLVRDFEVLVVALHAV
jgi:hypothetical protein